MTLENAITKLYLKKNPLYFPGVVIGDNQILPNLSASVLASILGLFINSKLDLSSVCFFFARSD